MKIKVHAMCWFCEEEFTQEIEVPDGWAAYDPHVSTNYCACPKHAEALQFFNDQCPGCITGPKECNLYKIYTSTCPTSIPENEAAIIRAGRCPCRASGTFSFTHGEGTREIDLSEVSKAGEALLRAIKDSIAIQRKYRREANARYV